MKRPVVFLSIHFFVFQIFAQGIWFTGTWEEAKALAKKEGKMILIDFYRDG